jgi:pyruvate,orthophosphate dikinase
MGKPSIVGAGTLTISEKDKTFTVDGKVVKEGDYLSFDGLKGEVKLGKLAPHPSEILQVVNGGMDPKRSEIYQRFSKLLEWADKVRRLGIRANADLPDQAELAYAFGARGIGLCRTEHMFFGEDRLPIVQRMILADNPQDRKKSRDGAAAAAAWRLLRRVQSDARIARNDPNDRPAAARVSAEA